MIYISVCKQTVARNRKNGTNDPPIRVSVGKHGKPFHQHAVHFEGKGRVVYSPDNPLPWGARAWIEIETNKLDKRT
jgi:hypothetical protein